MAGAFLLTRLLLQFDPDTEESAADLSAVASDAAGNLWLAADEAIGGRNILSRLSPDGAGGFACPQPLPLADAVDLDDNDGEADIEGMDFAEGWLWVVGSHSRKRARAKGKQADADLQRLARLTIEPNRFLLARLPVDDAGQAAAGREAARESARLAVTGDGNALTQALADDPHLGAIVRSALPAKENGFDIEGLTAAADGRVVLGLRGPVLRGWAVLLEVAPGQEQPGALDLPPLAADGRCYRKHLVNLDGLGVRDLALIDGDLYILAGPTMDHDGPQRIYRLRDWGDLPDVSLTAGDTGRLACVFDLPYRAGADRAEGITRFGGCGERALLVVYDGPAAERRVGDTAVYADVFRLP